MAGFIRAPVVMALVWLAPPVLAYDLPRPDCTCQNLESLQQDYQNAVYLEGYMRKLAAHLKAEEDRLNALKLTSNADPDGNVDVYVRTGQMAKDYAKQNLHPPFPSVKGYTGPAEASMTWGNCAQAAADLAALEKGSVCKALADVALDHERGHRDICDQMGAIPYWTRPVSEVMLEEAAMYRLQATQLKLELRKVLEDATIQYRGQWRHTLTGQGMTVTYFYESQTGDIGNASGGDTWTMTGKGETAKSIESLKLPGMSCTSQGAVRQSVEVALTTDGLTFGLESRESRVAGDVSVTCDVGGGMTLPTNDAGTGEITRGQALVAGDNPLPYGWTTAMKLVMKMGGMEVTGDPDFVLSVTCPAP